MLRRVLLILLDNGINFVTWVETPVDDGAAELLDRVFETLNAQHEDPASHITCVAADCAVYDWSFRRLPDDLAVGQVPEPGVLIAVSPVGADHYSEPGEAPNPLLLQQAVRASLRRDETYGPRLERFLTGPDALWEPDPIPLHDAFVSYSTRDALLAHEIVRELAARDLKCFLAEISLAAGRLWAEELRLALAASRVGVILVTPQSVSSAWVLAEVGATWSHAKAVVPVLAEVNASDVPPPLKPHMDHAVDAGDPQALAAMLEGLRA
jgi:hypothetical protein